jgi:hypothetical protein
VLEWRPRLIAVIVVVVLIAAVAGMSYWGTGPMNWEW